MRRDAALRTFPELRQNLGNAASAQEAVDTLAANARQQSLDYQRGAARHFLNAEPMQAVQSALNGKNPVGDFRELSRLVASDPDAKAGLQRAVAEYLVARVVREPVGAETGTMNRTAFNAVLKRDMALREVFSPEQIQTLHSLAADLQRSSTPLPKGQTAAPSGGVAAVGSLLSRYLGEGLFGLGGYLFGGIHGAIEGAGGYGLAKNALAGLRRSGIDNIDKALTEALLDPEKAKTLLMKATPANRPFIAARLASQFGTLGAVAAGSDAANENRRHAQPVATRPAPRVAARPALPPAPASGPGLWGSMVPGGAFRRVVP
jgi:hypothetical protein